MGARVDTWKPKHMVGMALKTAVQEVELEQTSIRRVKDAETQPRYLKEHKIAHLVEPKPGVTSLSGQIYFIMTTTVTYQVPSTLKALQ